MKKRNLVLVILAVLLVFGMVMSCGPADEEEGGKPGTGTGDVSVTFNGVTQDSTATKVTTQLTLTFSRAITGLSADNITLSGVAGVTKGTLGGSGPSYTLPISGFSAGGNLSVAVAAPTGYKITGSPKSVAITSASDLAKVYFGIYKTTYMLGTPQVSTNEFVTVDAAGNSLIIEEKANDVSKDKLVFTINSWEVATVPNDVVDPNENGSQFKIGFKIKGKITAVSGANEYIGSTKTSPGFVAADVNTTDCWMFIWVGTYQFGKVLVRSPFSKASKDNEATHFVTGSNNIIRVYLLEEDD